MDTHHTIKKIVCGCLILAILTSTIGCHSLQRVPVTVNPTGERTSEDMDQALSSLPDNGVVKIVLRDGTSVKGRLVSYQDTVLQIKTNKKVETIRTTDISVLYMMKSDEAANTFAVLMGLGLAGFMGFIIWGLGQSH